jgi:ATP-dependent exoDNAse (exonuclease V) beta subunit
MPEEAADPREDADEIEFTAADLGHAVHDILARLDFSADLRPQIASLLTEIVGEPLRAEAAPLIERFAQSPWAGELRRADRILKEVPFEIVVGGRIIPGRIDALFRDSGGWTVLDYKIGRAEDRERYELQVGIYAHAVSKLLGEMPARVGLIFLSIGEEWVQSTSDGDTSSRAAEALMRVIGGIDEARFDPVPGAHCDFCAGSPQCGKELSPIE